jgi:hypothetical protein
LERFSNCLVLWIVIPEFILFAGVGKFENQDRASGRERTVWKGIDGTALFEVGVGGYFDRLFFRKEAFKKGF